MMLTGKTEELGDKPVPVPLKTGIVVTVGLLPLIAFLKHPLTGH
jgi:hypothetical protein